jgi:hypothetical protein
LLLRDRDCRQVPMYRSMALSRCSSDVLIQIVATRQRNSDEIPYVLRFYSGLLLQIIGKLNPALAGG